MSTTNTILKSYLEDAGIAFRLSLPHQRFNRVQGVYAGFRFDPEGKLEDLGFGSRMTHVATLLGGDGKVTLTPVQ